MTMNEKKYCVALWQYVTVMTANTTNITKLIDRMAFSPFESVSPAKTFAKTRALSVPAPAPNRAHGCCIWIGTNGSLAQSTGSPAAPGFERAPSQKKGALFPKNRQSHHRAASSANRHAGNAACALSSKQLRLR
jgi:hypothetical protein